ncbi:unnamed protein product [Anisakis simplex]|uniref:VWFA domain-containing protein n=1 Tax=Anisakis simplex TaxID=6269 RepID=A0A158PMZ9_ANISI|nr:unnamed protein product [Anisakis simplex]
MASKTTYIFAAIAALIVALLIVCIGLLSAIFVNQQKQPPVPNANVIKNVVVLADASSGVDEMILTNEADFLSKYFRDSLLKPSKDYTVKIAASAFASQLSSELNYVDLSDADEVNKLADKIRNSHTDQPLDIGAALSSLIKRKQMTIFAASPLGQYTLVLMASGQGKNYETAKANAQTLKDNGITLITIDLNGNREELNDIASSVEDSFNGKPISSGDTTGMSQLAKRISDVVDQQPPVTIQPSTETPSQPPTPTPSHHPPANTRVLILVDGSKGITQPQMIKQTAFIENQLREAMLYPSEHGHRTEVLLIAYAFDTSPDNSEYITLDLSEWVQPVMNTKLAPVTTFVEPLDLLQLGQALTEVSTQEVLPTHLLVLASGQGTDFQKALTAAQKLKDKQVKIITLATVGESSELNSISSDPSFALDGRDILTGQDLESMAKNIVKCIYPQSALPSKPKPRKRISQKVVLKQKPKLTPAEVAPQLPVITAVPTSNDFVILIDVSTGTGVGDLVKKDSLIPKLNTKFAGRPNRVEIIPYAYFTAAVAEKFTDLSDTDEILKQIHTAEIATITSFMSPLDEYNLEYTLKLLNGSYFVKSTETKIVLITNDQDSTASQQVNKQAKDYAKDIITGTNKKLAVIGINGKIKAYDEIPNKPDMNIDGSAIKLNTVLY